MSWLFIAIVAQIILGTSAVFDKLLLKRKIFDPWIYTFWIGIFGLVSFALIPFGFHALPVPLLFYALFAGVIFIFGLFFLFSALEKGQAGTVVTFVGSLSPIATLAIGSFLLSGTLPRSDLVGFLLLVAGAFIFFFLEKKEFRGIAMVYALLSVICFGFYSVLAKVIFEESSFITGFVWIKSGAALLVLSSLLLPQIRKKITYASFEPSGSYRVFYGANVLYAGIGSVLANFAISLAHPALVDATQSLKYAVVFIAAWFLLHERFRGKMLLGKIAAIFLIMCGLIWLGVVAYARNIPVDMNRPITWGVTFSSKFSKELGLDWRENFTAILYEVQPRKIRLVAYWDEIERTRGVFDFTDLDWQMDQMAQRGIRAVLAIGMRVPRWPECHIPEWAQNEQATKMQHDLEGYMTRVIERYKHHPVFAVWQLENEPFLAFGLCPKREKDFFERELTLLKSLDSTHPVLVTDSGEFGAWHRAVREGDIFGTTMYRRVYPPSVGRFTGIIDYPIGPSFFRLREQIARFLTGESDKPFVVIELQGEPWGMDQIPALSYAQQSSLFSSEYFRDTLRYAKETGFDEYYWWGAEWWYAMREKHGDARYWEIAKGIFQK